MLSPNASSTCPPLPGQNTYPPIALKRSEARIRPQLQCHIHLEHEGDVLAGELAVDRGEAVELVLEAGGVLGVKEALDELVAVSCNTGALASDLGGEDEVLEDGSVDSRKGTAAGTLLLNARATAGLAKDPALANEDDVAVRELLLELAGQPEMTGRAVRRQQVVLFVDQIECGCRSRS